MNVEITSDVDGDRYFKTAKRFMMGKIKNCVGTALHKEPRHRGNCEWYS